MNDDPEALLALAEEAIARVRELHNEAWLYRDTTGISKEVCHHCLQLYPCPTIKALDGEQ